MPGSGKGRPAPKAFGARVNATSINTPKYSIGDGLEFNNVGNQKKLSSDVCREKFLTLGHMRSSPLRCILSHYKASLKLGTTSLGFDVSPLKIIHEILKITPTTTW
jgi:hypothetical protein